MLTNVGSALAGLMFACAMFQQYFPYDLRKVVRKLTTLVYPYVQIRVDEFSGEQLTRSPAYSDVESYLSARSSRSAKRLKAEFIKDRRSPVLSMDDQEEVTDEFGGVKVWWSSSKTVRNNMSFSYHVVPEENRFFTLTFHERHREVVTESYLSRVISEGKAIAIQNRQRKLYVNNGSDQSFARDRSKWSHVVFEHPASFDTLALEAGKKKEIMDDLIEFRDGKEYYARIGKAWKRGYLLHGPPGTGKSTMIAAMANLLNYDIYDLELTTVTDNTELRKLLIETSSKSILVIEDIDCSLDLTGQRKNNEEEEEDTMETRARAGKKGKASKVTLSGLLNVIDGLWSACGGERLVVFTTNHVDNLDEALIRKGRMDKHIELSYCSFEGFKVLALNYLCLKSHDLFETIRELLEETDMTPADVADNLMCKYSLENKESCLERLIEALRTVEKKDGKEKQKEKEMGNEEIEANETN